MTNNKYMYSAQFWVEDNAAILAENNVQDCAFSWLWFVLQIGKNAPLFHTWAFYGYWWPNFSHNNTL